MSTHAAQANSSPQRASSCLDVVKFHARIAIGATGAPSIAHTSDPAITATRSATGTYALTYPKGKKAFPSFTLLSAAKTVGIATLTAIDATAGTATVKTISGTTDTDPASGDAILFTVEVER